MASYTDNLAAILEMMNQLVDEDQLVGYQLDTNTFETLSLKFLNGHVTGSSRVKDDLWKLTCGDDREFLFFRDLKAKQLLNISYGDRSVEVKSDKPTNNPTNVEPVFCRMLRVMDEHHPDKMIRFNHYFNEYVHTDLAWCQNNKQGPVTKLSAGNREYLQFKDKEGHLITVNLNQETAKLLEVVKPETKPTKLTEDFKALTDVMLTNLFYYFDVRGYALCLYEYQEHHVSPKVVKKIDKDSKIVHVCQSLQEIKDLELDAVETFVEFTSKLLVTN